VRRPRVWLALAVALMLAACAPSGHPPPPPTTANGCAEPSVIDLNTGWLFRTDPDDVGLSQQWYGLHVEDTSWEHLAPGEPWESSGLAYDGVAWYRTTISLPPWRTVYLGFGKVDDTATLWVDGERQMSWEAGDHDSDVQAFDLTAFGKPGDEIVLALRIEDEGGYGGIKGPVGLSDEPRGVMGDVEYIKWLSESHADWPMPNWIRGAPLAWTMSGLPGAEEEALVRSDGAVAPWATAPTAEIWLYDPASGQLATGIEEVTSFSLHGGYLPMPTWEWEALDTRVQSVLFGDVQERAIRWQVSVCSNSEARRSLFLLLVVRPFGINRSVAPMCSVGLQGESRLWIDGSPFLIAGTPPAEAGVGSLDEVMTAAMHGDAPSGDTSFEDPSGLGAAVLVYPLSSDKRQYETLQFAFPIAPEADAEKQDFPALRGRAASQLADTAVSWESILERVRVEVPDELVSEGVKASSAYLLLALDPNGPHPGPLTHDALWVRDAAYIGLALLQLGHADAVRAYIPDILASQEPDGRVPPIQGTNIPWDDEEWDAQGQTIFLATSYYRYTGDAETLKTWYPALRAAARFIVDLRASEGETDGPARGLLPPSKSAEDLGPADQHYYWDNLWAVTGLKEAAYAARELGEVEDAAWMEAEADALHDAILRSVERVMGPDPAYIPGAVEDVESSSMARGTVPALWPIRVLSPERPLVERSFRTYHQRWLAPDDGGFRHRQDQFWPYGGLELAHAYLRLGYTDKLHQILGWTLRHETLPGTFAWAEQVDPETGAISGGDMPHAWAAASYVTLVREMLITENGGALDLFNGAPGWWFEEGETITLEGAPTHFGALDLRTESTVRQTDSDWDGTLIITLSGAEPPQGFRWRLPDIPVGVAGPPGTRVADDQLSIPAGGGTIRLSFGGE